MRGRPTTSPEFVRLRQAAWNRAVKVSDLTHQEIADAIGKSAAIARSYGSRLGNTPSDEAIAVLKRHNLQCALETLAERYGPKVVSEGLRPWSWICGKTPICDLGRSPGIRSLTWP